MRHALRRRKKSIPSGLRLFHGGQAAKIMDLTGRQTWLWPGSFPGFRALACLSGHYLPEVFEQPIPERKPITCLTRLIG
jgi:hypothetical protein